MFVIAGVSPKTKTLDRNPRRCPTCGLFQAYYKRIDHYFNLFFIPIVRVKKGEPLLMCDRCERAVHEADRYHNDMPEEQFGSCSQCGKAVEKNYAFCPYCGTPKGPE